MTLEGISPAHLKHCANDVRARARPRSLIAAERGAFARKPEEADKERAGGDSVPTQLGLAIIGRGGNGVGEVTLIPFKQPDFSEFRDLKATQSYFGFIFLGENLEKKMTFFFHAFNQVVYFRKRGGSRWWHSIQTPPDAARISSTLSQSRLSENNKNRKLRA